MSSLIWVILSAAVVISSAAVGWLLWRRNHRKNAEGRRREWINRDGRIVEGIVHDLNGGVAIYTWSWQGIDYEASQDLRSLAHLLPESEAAVIGPVSVKFLPRDPSNSIILSENWSGFRVRATTPGR